MSPEIVGWIAAEENVLLERTLGDLGVPSADIFELEFREAIVPVRVAGRTFAPPVSPLSTRPVLETLDHGGEA